jgi:hypothetical protein
LPLTLDKLSLIKKRAGSPLFQQTNILDILYHNLFLNASKILILILQIRHNGRVRGGRLLPGFLGRRRDTIRQRKNFRAMG